MVCRVLGLHVVPGFASYNVGGHDDAEPVRSDHYAETALR